MPIFSKLWLTHPDMTIWLEIDSIIETSLHIKLEYKKAFDSIGLFYDLSNFI